MRYKSRNERTNGKGEEAEAQEDPEVANKRQHPHVLRLSWISAITSHTFDSLSIPLHWPFGSRLELIEKFSPCFWNKGCHGGELKLRTVRGVWRLLNLN